MLLVLTRIKALLRRLMRLDRPSALTRLRVLDRRLAKLDRHLNELRNSSPSIKFDEAMKAVVDEIKGTLGRRDFVHEGRRSRTTTQDTLKAELPSEERFSEFTTQLRSVGAALEKRVERHLLKTPISALTDLLRLTTWVSLATRTSMRRDLKRLTDATNELQSTEKERLDLAKYLATYPMGDIPTIGKFIDGLKLTLPGVLSLAILSYGTFHLSALFALHLFGVANALLITVLTVGITLVAYRIANLSLQQTAAPEPQRLREVRTGLLLPMLAVLLHLIIVVYATHNVEVDLFSFIRFFDAGFLAIAALLYPLFLWRRSELRNFDLRTLGASRKRLSGKSYRGAAADVATRCGPPPVPESPPGDMWLSLFLERRFDSFVLGLVSLTLALVVFSATAWVLVKPKVACERNDAKVALLHVTAGRILASVSVKGEDGGWGRTRIESLSNSEVPIWRDNDSQCETLTAAVYSGGRVTPTEEGGADGGSTEDGGAGEESAEGGTEAGSTEVGGAARVSSKDSGSGLEGESTEDGKADGESGDNGATEDGRDGGGSNGGDATPAGSSSDGVGGGSPTAGAVACGRRRSIGSIFVRTSMIPMCWSPDANASASVPRCPSLVSRRDLWWDWPVILGVLTITWR